MELGLFLAVWTTSQPEVPEVLLALSEFKSKQFCLTSLLNHGENNDILLNPTVLDDGFNFNAFIRGKARLYGIGIGKGQDNSIESRHSSKEEHWKKQEMEVLVTWAQQSTA